MDENEPDFVGAVPWKGPNMSKEKYNARKNAATAYHLQQLTASPEYGQWVANKRRWKLKDLMKAALTLATLGGLTAVVVQPKLWPASMTPAQHPFSSGLSAQQHLPAADRKPQTVGSGDWSEPVARIGEGVQSGGVAARSKASGVKDGMRESLHKLEDQMRSGEKYIKDKVLHSGSRAEISRLQARADELEAAVKDLEGSAWFDGKRIAALQSRNEALEADLTMYTTLLSGLSLILGALWLQSRRSGQWQRGLQKVTIDKVAEAERKLEKEAWDHRLLQDLHAGQSQEKAALQQALEELQNVHAQLLQAQSRGPVAPPPGLHPSPFENQEAPEEVNLNGHSSEDDSIAAHREEVVVELFPDKPARRSTSSTGGYWPAGPRNTTTRVPAINIKEKDKHTARISDTAETPKVLTEAVSSRSNGLSARSDRLTEGGEENRVDLDGNVTLSARELRKLQRSVGEKEKYVRYMDSQNKTLEAQLEQVTASLAHFVEEKSDVTARLHSESQDLDEMAILLARKVDDLEFVEAEFLALQQVARQAVQWLHNGQEPPEDVLTAMQDRLNQCSQHFEDKISSEF